MISGLLRAGFKEGTGWQMIAPLNLYLVNPVDSDRGNSSLN